LHKDLERRTAMHGVEARAKDDKKTLVGYAAVFNVEADIGGYWMERIEPGAFTKSLGGDVRALVNHDSGRVIGRTKSGTLRLAEDAKGLAVEIDMPDTSDGRDLWTLVERGDISGMSFGFLVTRQEWDETAEPPVRTIKEVELHEISAVAWPAYGETEIGMRSLDAARAEAEKQNPATPVSRAALRARLSMGLDLKVRNIR